MPPPTFVPAKGGSSTTAKVTKPLGVYVTLTWPGRMADDHIGMAGILAFLRTLGRLTCLPELPFQEGVDVVDSVLNSTAKLQI
jgi:hypothetical protein